MAKLVSVFLAAAGTLLVAGASQAAERTVTLVAFNAACTTGEPIIRGTLSRLPGVGQVIIIEDQEYSQAVVTVTFDDLRITPQELVTATYNAGFPALLQPDAAPAY